MRLILAIPTDSLSKAGPVAVGKRGGKIYGYDAKGKPIYAPGDVPEKPKHRGQAGYAERREATAERKLERAKKLEAEAAAREKAARTTMDIIPMGQPILVGHHSEGRHRRDLKRMRSNFDKAREAQEKAERLKSAARNPSGAISSDDPEAVVKLKKKMAYLEKTRDFRKKLNRVYRKHKGDWDKVAAELDLAEDVVDSYKASMAQIHWEKMPVPGYELTNLGARIRDIKKRIENLAAEAEATPAAPVEGAGWSIHEDVDDNRIWVEFDKKPPRDITQSMRRQGFKWSPTRSAWVRQLNNAGRYAAERVASILSETSLPGAVSPTTEKPVETERETQKKQEAPLLKEAAKHQSRYARRHMAAEAQMNTATGVQAEGLSTAERSKKWNEAAEHLQHAVENARDRNAVWEQISALRGEKRDKSGQDARDIARVERNAALARAKAANPDAYLDLPEGVRNENFTHESKRTREIQKAKERHAAKVQRLEGAAERARLMLAREAKAKEPLKPKEPRPTMLGREVKAVKKPRAKPEKKPATKGKMAAREKAGQQLLLSRTAQLHLDR